MAARIRVNKNVNIFQKLFRMLQGYRVQGSGQLHDVAVREGPPVLPGQEGQGHPARLREDPHRQEDRVTQVKPSPKISVI